MGRDEMLRKHCTCARHQWSQRTKGGLTSLARVQHHRCIYFSERPLFDEDSIQTSFSDDVIVVFWETPQGSYTTLMLNQCLDEDDNCMLFDVTDVNSIVLNKAGGTWLTFVVWQDRDEVLSVVYDAQFHRTHGSSSDGNSGE